MLALAQSSSSSSSSSSSPSKPRLIWRGALHLQDGTALQGVAFISNVQPSFSSRASSSNSDHGAFVPPSISAKPPLTLSKEQQDALSLSIEMVRHAPINIVEVVEKVDRDTTGLLLRPRSNLSSSNSRKEDDNIRISYEAAGGIRMYVDPAYPSTVAYMERVFCYGEDEEEEEAHNDQKESGRQVEEAASTSNVVVLSLDKSFRYSLNPATDSDDVFTDDAMSAWHSLRSSAIEAVLIGVKTKGQDGKSILELHVGQKVVSKSIRDSSTRTSFGQDQRPTNPFGTRPDDPAPRGLSRVLSAKYRSSTQFTSRKSFSSLPATTSKDSSSSLKRPILSNSLSDGDARSSSMPNLKRQGSLKDRSTSSTKVEKRLKLGEMETSKDYADEDGKIEERNRSLIKKLVHHQLLGKGLEKKDADYLACFNPTCNGTVLAFKRQFKTEIIDKTQAAIIVEKHLDMYL